MSSRVSASGLSSTSGWMLKLGPSLGDRDKRDTLGRKMKLASGYLRRQLTSISIGAGNSTRRFFVLEGLRLTYYRDDTQHEELGSIDMSRVQEVRASQQSMLPNAIDLVRRAGGVAHAASPHAARVPPQPLRAPCRSPPSECTLCRPSQQARSTPHALPCVG